jgi:hypothetical protein
MGRHVVDKLASSYFMQSVFNAAGDAEAATSRLAEKYSMLDHSYDVYPVTVKTLGPVAATSQLFISGIGRRITQRTQTHKRQPSCISRDMRRFYSRCYSCDRLSPLNSQVALRTLICANSETYPTHLSSRFPSTAQTYTFSEETQLFTRVGLDTVVQREGGEPSR